MDHQLIPMDLQANHIYRRVRTILLVMVFILIAGSLEAQPATGQSGFFPGDTVVLFMQDVSSYDSVHIAVNCEDIDDAACWMRYSGGAVELEDRSLEPNDWADGPFSRNIPEWFSDWIFVDESQPRNNLDKVNVVRLRYYINGTVTEDILHIGVGMPIPTNTADGAITFVDYDKVDDMVGPAGHYGPGDGYMSTDTFVLPDTAIIANVVITENYMVSISDSRSFAEKPVTVTIYDPAMNRIFRDRLGISNSAGASIFLPNRGQKLTARDEYSGSNRMEAAFFGETELFKQVRLRSGGTSQMDNPCSYLGDPIALDAGGSVRNRFNVLYMNGIFWSLGFIQEATKRHWVEDRFGYDRSKVDIVEADQPDGIKCEPYSPLVAQADSLGINNGLGEGIFGELALTPDDYCVCGKVIDGDGRSFGRYAREVVDNENIGRIDLRSLWDHILFNAFFQNVDHTINNTYFICDDREDPSWRVFGKDYDESFNSQAKLNTNEWLQFMDTSRTDIFSQVVRIALSSDSSREDFLRRAQDVLNTDLLPSNTIPQAVKRHSEIATVYEQQYNAWFPNVSSDPSGWNTTCGEDALTNYMNEKPNFIKQTLREDLLPDEDWLPENQHSISINLDDVQVDCGGSFRVHLNSLVLEESFTGKYYPGPSILIKVEVPHGYEFHGWMELPGVEGEELEIFLTEDRTLTPVISQSESYCNGTDQLVINEIFPLGEGPDWIEIYNPTAEAISLVGLALSDRQDELDKHIIMQDSDAFVPPLGYAVLFADGDGNAGWDHLNFKLNGTDGESIWLSAQGTVIDGFEFGPHQVNTSFGRCNGTLEYMDSVTMNAMNVCNLSTNVLNDQLVDNWQFYPNPAHDLLVLELFPPVITSYRITNEAGQAIIENRTSGQPADTIDISGLATGIYFLQIEDRIESFVKN